MGASLRELLVEHVVRDAQAQALCLREEELSFREPLQGAALESELP